MAETQLRVLSLNCWGLKYVSRNRKERVAGITQELAKSSYDIIALQELWVLADYELVRQSVSKRLPYAKFFYSGALGAGLAMFSRFPIISTAIHPYSLNGSPIDVGGGDWFVGKAAASIIIAHPVLGQVQVFNTHLFAKGGEDGPEHNRAHRLVNAWEFSKLARQAAELGRYVIAAGDFNSIPTTLPITVIREHAALSDAWLDTHPSAVAQVSSSSINVPSPLEAITRFGVTADSPLNSYSEGKPLDPHARKYWGKRLDYIFYRQPSRIFSLATDKPAILKSSDCKVVMTGKIPGYDFSYSDHFGLEAVFDIYTPGETEEDQSASRSSYTPSSAAQVTFPSELSPASISTTIQALTACYRFSRARARRELTVFGLCVLLVVAIAIGSSWLPSSWINPIFVVFTVFITWLGTTMLYQGFLFGQWEVNALLNVIEELEHHKKGLDIIRGDQRSTQSSSSY